MKTYLQRLAERAEGVSLIPPLSPARRHEITHEGESDSLVEETAGELFAESSQASSDIPRKPFQDAGKIVEPATQTSPRVQPRPQELSQPAEAPPGRAAVAEQPSAEDDGTEPNHLTPPKERDFSQRGVIEAHRDADNETTRKMDVHRAPPSENSAPQLSPVQPIDKPVIEKGPRIKHEAARLERLSADMLRRLVPPTQLVQRADHSAKEVIAAAAREKTIPNLEPRPAAPIQPLPPVADEPRLVIGQLRVDILPAVPTRTREAVQGRQRRSGASQWRRSQSVSKLRFGLGQM